jgi:hypothetical protein
MWKAPIAIGRIGKKILPAFFLPRSYNCFIHNVLHLKYGLNRRFLTETAFFISLLINPKVYATFIVKVIVGT